jgi:hypothetical protein
MSGSCREGSTSTGRPHERGAICVCLDYLVHGRMTVRSFLVIKGGVPVRPRWMEFHCSLSFTFLTMMDASLLKARPEVVYLEYRPREVVSLANFLYALCVVAGAQAKSFSSVVYRSGEAVFASLVVLRRRTLLSKICNIWKWQRAGATGTLVDVRYPHSLPDGKDFIRFWADRMKADAVELRGSSDEILQVWDWVSQSRLARQRQDAVRYRRRCREKQRSCAVVRSLGILPSDGVEACFSSFPDRLPPGGARTEEVETGVSHGGVDISVHFSSRSFSLGDDVPNGVDMNLGLDGSPSAESTFGIEAVQPYFLDLEKDVSSLVCGVAPTEGGVEDEFCPWMTWLDFELVSADMACDRYIKPSLDGVYSSSSLPSV